MAGKLDDKLFDRPIPGMALTQELGKFPWQQPPMITDRDEAVQFYIDKFQDDDLMDDVIQLMESGVPVNDVTQAMLRLSVANGTHSIDTALIVGPVVHQYLKSSAKIMGVDVIDEFDTNKKKAAAKSQRMISRASMLVKGITDEEIATDPGKQFLKDVSEMPVTEDELSTTDLTKASPESMPSADTAMPTEPTAPAMSTAPAPKGLMSRSAV